jgi:hypothetical protein
MLRAALAIATAACGGENAHEPVLPSGVASLALVSGDNQAGAAGSLLAAPVIARTLNAAGNPVAGVVVSFSVTAGGGSVTAALDTSDASGRVTADWTIGTKVGDAQRLVVAVAPSGATANIQPLAISAVVTAAEPTTLRASADTITGRVGEALSALSLSARDRYGNAASSLGLWITLRLAESDRLLVGTMGVRADTSGARFSDLVVTGRAGIVNLVAESEGKTSATIVLVLDGGKAAHLEPTGPTTVDAEAGAAGPPVSVRVLDQWGNPALATAVTFTIPEIGAIGRATSGAGGIATLTSWTVPAIGNYQIVASTVGTLETARVLLTAHRPPPALLTSIAPIPTSAMVGSPVDLVIKATDAAGLPVPDAILTWTSPSYSNTSVTDTDGVAHVHAIIGKKAGPSSIIVSASPTVSVTFSVLATPGYPIRVKSAVDSLTVPAGTSIDLRFTLFDQFDNVIPGVRFYGFNTGTNAQITPSAVTDANGVALFTVVLDAMAGTSYIWLANTPSSQAYQWATVEIFSTSSRGAMRPFFTPDCVAPFFPSSSSVAVRVFGPNGRWIGQVPILWTLAPGGGSIDPSGLVVTTTLTTLSDANGISQVSWNLPKVVGTYFLTAGAPQGYDGSPLTFTCQLK